MLNMLEFSKREHGAELASVWNSLMKNKKIYDILLYHRSDVEYIDLDSIKDDELRNLAIDKGYHETCQKIDNTRLEILDWLTEMQYVEKSDTKMHVVSIASEYTLLAPSLHPFGHFSLNGPTHSGWSEHTFDDDEFELFSETYAVLKKKVDAKLWPHVEYINAGKLYSYDTTRYEVKDAFFDSIHLNWNNNENKLVVNLTEPFYTSEISSGKDRKNWRRIKELSTDDFFDGVDGILEEISEIAWKKNIDGIISFENTCYHLKRSEKTGALDSENMDILGNVNLSDLPNAVDEFENNRAEDYVKCLGNELVKLWTDCNNSAKQVPSLSGDVFKLTNKIVLFVSNQISQVCSNEPELMEFAKDMDQWINEASGQGKRIPPSLIKDEVISIIYELRKHVAHDREHGKPKEVSKKYKMVGKIYKIFAKTAAPSSPKEWFMIQVGIMLSAKCLLNQTLALISVKGMDEEE